MNTMLKENLYEVEFDDLNRKDVESFENNNSICLDKTIDEDLDIYVNDKCVATGESIKIEDKISIRITNFKKCEE